MTVAEDSFNQGSVVAKPGWLARLVGANSTYQARKALWGYVFALPWIIGLIVFWGGPILASFYFSFTEYGVTSAHRLSDWRTIREHSPKMISFGLPWAGHLCFHLSLCRWRSAVGFFWPFCLIRN